jgi:hypothetical protein
MQTNASRNDDPQDASSIASGERQSTESHSFIEDDGPTLPSMPAVIAAEPTSPCASPGPILSPSEWPNSAELASGVSANGAFDFADATALTGNVADPVGGTEQSAHRDTTPAPPPCPDDAA